MIRRLDLLYLADPRFPGGTSASMAVEIAAALRAGYSCGLMMVHGPILRQALQIHPDLRALLDDGGLARIDPAETIHCQMALVHHPNILDYPWSPRPRVSAKRVLVVLHHAAKDGAGKTNYDLTQVLVHARAAFDAPIDLAPVSAIVRNHLPLPLPDGMGILSSDWTNLIALDDWPRRPARALAKRVVIGRHARPDARKWPNRLADALAAYPDSDDIQVRILGGGDFLAKRYDGIPAHWEVLPFAHDGVKDFLQSLDFYVYFHSDGWVEAFGRTVLEAICTGLVVILTRDFEPIFGDSALYCAPSEVADLIARLRKDPKAYAEQADRARQYAKTHFSDVLIGARLQALDVTPGQLASPTLAQSPLPERQVLFVSSNGMGTGHLMRQMGVAKALPPGLRANFFTMSYAKRVVSEAGYIAEFFPHHAMAGKDGKTWNADLAEALIELLVHLRPSVVVYDATAVFDGVLRALDTYGAAFTIWLRRAMWQSAHAKLAKRFDHFDAVIEPGELAGSFDFGATVAQQNKALLVDPVLNLAPSARLSRDAARERLGLSGDGLVVALQLGSGNNFDMRSPRARILAELLSYQDVTVFEMRSPITRGETPPAPLSPHHVVRTVQPSYLYSRAFDAAVTAAGYNAFHEMVFGGIPTLFVPNEGENMDMQVNRALWAELNGLGTMFRKALDEPRLPAIIARLLDPDERAQIARRAAGLKEPKGDQQIARFISDHGRLIRADRHPAIEA